MQEETRESKSALPRFFTLEMFMFTVTALSGLVLLWSIAVPYRNVAIMVCAGVVFTLSIVVVIRLIMDPDSVRARQSDSMLKLASQTLTCMNDGMDYKAAQKICGLLLPSTAAIAVAITDKKQILGYAGFEEAQNLPGSIIRTHATHATLADGKDGKRKQKLSAKEKAALIANLEKEMKEASRRLEFEYAAVLRDQIIELRGKETAD